MSKLETNQVDPASGTTLTLGTSGDTIAIPSGVTIANSGTATGFGGTSTPAFEAYPSGTQTISADSWTKLNFATERFDTDGKYDASTSKFTPTVSGKYYIYAIMDVAPSGNGDQIGLRIYKNGSLVTQNVLGLTSQYIKSGNNNAWFAYSTQISDTDDYFEIYGYFSDNAAVVQTTGTLFGAYKLIE